MKYKLGSIVIMKKEHPCGTNLWEIVRLGVDIVLCLDKDVKKEELEELAERFPDGVPLYYMFDEDNILGEKESPTDDPIKWKHLVENNIYRLR